MGTITIGANTYDIHGTRPLADIYMAARLGASAWTLGASSDKDKSLVSATRFIDRYNWAGQKTVSSQPLEFPRTGLLDKDGNAVPSVSTPVAVEEACYEIALLLLADPAAFDSGTTASNTKRVKAGPAEVEFFRPEDGSKLPDAAQLLIGLFLEGSAPSGGGNFASGTDEESSFCDQDRFGYTKGLA